MTEEVRRGEEEEEEKEKASSLHRECWLLQAPKDSRAACGQSAGQGQQHQAWYRAAVLPLAAWHCSRPSSRLVAMKQLQEQRGIPAGAAAGW